MSIKNQILVFLFLWRQRSCFSILTRFPWKLWTLSIRWNIPLWIFRNFPWRIRNAIFWNFWKSGQPCQVDPNFRNFLTGNKRSIWLFSRSTRNFQLNGSLLKNSKLCGRFGNSPGKFWYYLSPFRNQSSEYLAEWEAPYLFVYNVPSLHGQRRQRKCNCIRR